MVDGDGGLGTLTIHYFGPDELSFHAFDSHAVRKGINQLADFILTTIIWMQTSNMPLSCQTQKVLEFDEIHLRIRLQVVIGGIFLIMASLHMTHLLSSSR